MLTVLEMQNRLISDHWRKSLESSKIFCPKTKTIAKTFISRPGLKTKSLSSRTTSVSQLRFNVPVPSGVTAASVRLQLQSALRPAIRPGLMWICFRLSFLHYCAFSLSGLLSVSVCLLTRLSEIVTTGHRLAVLHANTNSANEPKIRSPWPTVLKPAEHHCPWAACSWFTCI